MSRSHAKFGGIIVAILGLTASPLSSQIDNRVNQGNAATAGRALDSNPASGSSRFNLTRPGTFDAGVRSNAIITGNVTGLDYFHGSSPLLNNNQFRETLPSSDLSGFRAQSVGLSDVLNNRTRSGGFYFDRSQTVTDAGYVRAGLNQPGSSFVQTPNTPPPQNFTTDNSSAYLLQRLPDPSDRRVSIPRPDFQAGMKQTQIGGVAVNKSAAIDLSPYQSAVGSSIFGTPTPPVRPALTGGLVSDRIDETDNLRDLASRALADDPSLRRVDSSASSLVQPVDESVGGTSTEGRTSADAVAKAQASISPETPSAPFSFPLERPADLGQDRFADLYNAVGVAGSLGIMNLGFDVDEQPIGEIAEPETAEAGNVRIPGSLMRDSGAGLKQLSETAKWASEVIDEPLRTFAGRYKNKLNDYMLAGEDELHRGQYYSAARYFELANSIDPMNPLPLLARGHALAAAGDYRSAVRYITLGIERFPQIAAFRIDLPALLGRPDVFDIRRADLEDKLAVGENRELRFLLGYLELYSGLPDEGIQNLRIAAKASPPESIIGMFVDLILGLRELPPIGK
ncbi:MAG: hypothetical protein AMXMBFR20_19840 [Planctomycetia bacterium]